MSYVNVVGPFSMVPKEVSRGMTGAPKDVYIELLNHGTSDDDCFPSVARIASFIDAAEGTVSRAITQLETWGWVKRIDRYDEDSGRRKSNGYVVHTELKGCDLAAWRAHRIDTLRSNAEAAAKAHEDALSAGKSEGVLRAGRVKAREAKRRLNDYLEQHGMEPEYEVPQDETDDGGLCAGGQGVSDLQVRGSLTWRSPHEGNQPKETKRNTPSRPDKSGRKESPSPDVVRLCEHLADRIAAHREANDLGRSRPPITNEWHKQMRLLIERGPLNTDSPAPMTPAKIQTSIDAVFEWLATPKGSNGFCWADQLRSPGKLREEWFRLGSQVRNAQQANSRTGRGPASDAEKKLARALAGVESAA